MTVTSRLFLAALRSMVGPPMSIFSMASSRVQSGLGDGGLEGVEVDHHHVDRFDAVLLHGRHVLGVVPQAEQAAMDLGMEGLDPAVQHLGKAGEIGNILDGDPFFPQQLGRPPGGEDLHSEAVEFPGEVNDSGFVGNADEGAFDGCHCEILSRSIGS